MVVRCGPSLAMKIGSPHRRSHGSDKSSFWLVIRSSTIDSPKSFRTSRESSGDFGLTLRHPVKYNFKDSILKRYCDERGEGALLRHGPDQLGAASPLAPTTPAATPSTHVRLRHGQPRFQVAEGLLRVGDHQPPATSGLRVPAQRRPTRPPGMPRLAGFEWRGK